MSLISGRLARMNTHGRIAYRVRHARRGFPWQRRPAADLPDEMPPGTEAVGATRRS